MIAVCVSGISSFIPEYEKVIELQRKVFPNYDFSFQQWDQYLKPNVPNCLYTAEPKWNYHVMEYVKVKPNCPIFKKITKKPQSNKPKSFTIKPNKKAPMPKPPTKAKPKPKPKPKTT